MTSTFYTRYNAIFSALKSKLVYVAAVPAHDDVPEVPATGLASIKTVVVGERYSYDAGLPAAIINVDPSPITPEDMQTLQVKVNFTVMLLCRTEEPDDWFTDVLAVMGDVIDAVLADRTLNNSVFDVSPTGFAPGNIKMANRTYFGGAVTFAAILLY